MPPTLRATHVSLFDGSLQGSTRERYCAERGLSPERKLVVYGTFDFQGSDYRFMIVDRLEVGKK